MQSRLRLLIAILLLLAAGVHPLVHVVGHDCPCVHGATAALEAPVLSPDPPAVATHVASVPAVLSVSVAGDVPARAPPAA